MPNNRNITVELLTVTAADIVTQLEAITNLFQEGTYDSALDKLSAQLEELQSIITYINRNYF